MKVYTVEENYIYDDWSMIIGVFSTKSKAQDYADKRKQSRKQSYCEYDDFVYTVDEFTVDEESL